MIVKTTTCCAILLLILFGSGCNLRTDLSQIKDWEPDLAAPLVYGEVTLGNLVNLFDTLAWLRIEPDGQFYLHLERELASVGAEDLFNIPDFSDVYDTSSTSTSFPLFSLEKGIFGQGNLGYKAYYPGTDSALMVVEFDELFNPDGTPFSFRDTFEGPGVYSGNIVMDGLELIPDALDFRGRYRLLSLKDASVITLDSLRIDFTDIYLQYAEGYFPNVVLELDSASIQSDILFPEDLPFPILTNPAIDLIVDNEFGVPNSLVANRLSFTYPGGQTIELLDSNLTQGFTLAYPTIPRESAQTIISLDRTNSNLDEIISALPNQIDYGGKLTLFPDNLEKSGFVFDTANISVGVRADFPLEFRTEPWTYEQWFPWDSLGIEEGGTTTFRLETENGFPVEVVLELYAADEDSTILSPFFSTPLTVSAPTLSPEGRVIETTQDLKFIEVEQNLLQTLSGASLILARIRLSTPSAGSVPVQLYSQDLFSFKLGIRHQR